MSAPTWSEDPRWYLFGAFGQHEDALKEGRKLATTFELSTLVVKGEVFVLMPEDYGAYKRFLEAMEESDYAVQQRSKGYATEFEAMQHRALHGPDMSGDEAVEKWLAQQDAEREADEELETDYRYFKGGEN